MNQKPWEHLIFGSLQVEMRGANVSSVVSEFQRAGINLRRLSVKQQTCTCVIKLRDFDQFYRICRRNHIKIRFQKRLGFPFLIKRMWRRKSFAFGAAAFVAILFVLSNMVWQVHVGGLDEDAAVALRQTAKESGLYVGAWKWKLPDVTKLQQKILEKSPNLVWVGVRLDGSVATIQGIEKIPGSQLESSAPTNIVAAKPGVIINVFPSRGKVVVKPGQFVKPGDVIISGVLFEGTNVPARGQALAEVWYTSKVTVPLIVKEDGLTGLSETRDYLDIGSVRIRVWGWKQPNYSASVEREHSTQWQIGGWVLPVQFRSVTEYQVSQSAQDVSLESAKEKAALLATQDVKSQMASNGIILNQKVLQQEVSHGTLYETVLTSTEEDIGAPVLLPQGSSS